MSSRSDLLATASALPDAPGIYIMRDDAGVEIYVGKAKSLRKRVSSYFRPKDRLGKEQALVENIHDFEYAETESEIEALLLESRLIKDLQPKYNVMLKNNEQYPMIEVTWGEDFPRVLIVRRRENPKSRYFGPFVSSGDVKACLNVLQRIFLYRTCNKSINAGDKRLRYQRGCLNYHIGRCAGACCARIDKSTYRKRIAGLCRFLAGQKKDLIAELRGEMEAASRELQFERAAELRDLVSSLETVNSQPALDDALAPWAPSMDPAEGVEALRKALDLEEAPRRIEGIDIANLQGKETVGSLVSFLSGLPFKDGYRRFRIKTVEGQDDFSSIAEVVGRRYGRLVREEEALPDIILIDGGKGQLRAAHEALDAVGATASGVILMSLAKEEETPFVWGRDAPLPLSKRNPGLLLLMHIRDEAHRFAQHYHHILRRKAMFGEK